MYVGSIVHREKRPIGDKRQCLIQGYFLNLLMITSSTVQAMQAKIAVGAVSLWNGLTHKPDIEICRGKCCVIGGTYVSK